MKKIYIVDDDRNIVESMKIVLEANGYSTKAQYNQENVVKNIKEYKPDLIILDVMFPEDAGAGFQMARDIKNNNSTDKIPIIMLSAINEKGVYAGTFSNRDRDDTWLPVEEFVEKPIKPKQLLETVKSYLS
jgi:CheY-like chemotaxis protein